MNAINIIKPYRWDEFWVFDDPTKDLDKEALIEGADLLIDTVVGDADKCSIMFSKNPFPNAQFKVEWVNSDDDNGGLEYGNWYYSETHGQKLWLCPALFKYFDEAPKEIYIKVMV